MDDNWQRRYGPRSEWDDRDGENVSGRPPPDNRPDRPSSPHVPRGTETILLVEDQAEVLDAIAALLRRLGYHVLPAEDLDEAVGVAGSLEEELHLLITDVVLPNRNGLAVAERIRELRPEVAILYMSAFTSDVVIPVADRRSGNFLAKPFTVEDIARKIRQILDGDVEEDDRGAPPDGGGSG